jgi:carbamoyltransferase
MHKSIASIYPCPFDSQIRHDLNSAIYFNGKIYAYEEAKVSSLKNDGVSHFPERSLFLGFKELLIKPSQINLWILPQPKKIDYSRLFLFFNFIKAFNGKIDHFKKWAKKKIKFIKHHDLHTYTAIGSSGFKNGFYLNIDGGGDFGDNRHTTWGIFENNKLKEYNNLKGLNSLGNFHNFISEFCGFSDNGKVSGLAGYGKIRKDLKKKLENAITVNNKGIQFRRKRYNFTECIPNNIDLNNYERHKILRPQSSITNISKICSGYLPQDVAATGEEVIIEKLLYFLKIIKKKYFFQQKNAVFSGGLFLNVRINNKIAESKIFDDCFFPMAPGDSGLALGGVFSQKLNFNNKKNKLGISPLLGPSFSDREINKTIKLFNVNFTKPKKIQKDIAKSISNGDIVGIFNGKAEFGPRSLGNRSILADPRKKISKLKLNQKIKKRDWFMPFAPAVLDKNYHKFFIDLKPSLYMQKAIEIKKKFNNLIPSAVHIDGTCRAQYVDKKIFPNFWKIIHEFKKITNIPIVLNTSFNRHGISTICSPRQAIEHLLEGNIDVLYLSKFKVKFNNNRIVKKVKFKYENEKNLLNKQNFTWLKKNKHLMDQLTINKFKKFLKNV